MNRTKQCTKQTMKRTTEKHHERKGEKHGNRAKVKVNPPRLSFFFRVSGSGANFGGAPFMESTLCPKTIFFFATSYQEVVHSGYDVSSFQEKIR